MRILKTTVLRGPNYWSTYRKNLIQLKLDLENYEQFPTNLLRGFPERLEAMIPSLYKHECSEKKPGGFFERVKEGTWLGHVAEHIALELQTLAGMTCGYGRTRSTGVKGVYHVVFSYLVEEAGLYAGEAAVRIVEALAENKPYDINEDIKELIRINRQQGLGPSSQAIVDVADRMNIPWRRMDDNSLIMFGQGKNQKTIRATVACTTSNLAVELAGNKEKTKEILKKGFVPVPRGVRIYEAEELEQAIHEIGFPMVIKPLTGNHGRGVTTNIQTPEKALKAFERASNISDGVIAEQFIQGEDYRFLVINYKLVAVAKRKPAMVIGDGFSTIQQLIDATNEDPNRGEGHEKTLTKIKIDSATLAILDQCNFKLATVLEAGQVLCLKDTANLSSGGTSRDVSHIVHPSNVFLAERIARLMNLDICGIDIIAQDINLPLTAQQAAVLEVNAGPGLRMHLAPTKGNPQNVAEPIVKMLFPDNAPSRIPLVAVTGTNGKTTTVRLIAHIAKLAGHTVGFTTTDGIYIGDQQVSDGDCSGPASAETVLTDPLVDFAVLECARGGILRTGLGFDKCNTSIITNVSEDHLGLDDINSLREMAKIKRVVAHSTLDNGYAILNADDDNVYNIARELDCNIALFSISGTNKRIGKHEAKGGLTAIVENGYFTVTRNGFATRIAKVKEVPLTLDGRAEAMIKNILPAILTAVIHNIDIVTLKRALQTFLPSAAQTPGRMNIFKFNRFQIMLDYAHNADGFNELRKFMQQTEASAKVGIIGGVGDRRDIDIINMGVYAANTFDEIIIRHDKDGRGRSNDEITGLLRKGIDKVKPYLQVKIISDELSAIQYAMDMAIEDSFIVVCSDEIRKSLDYLAKAKEHEDSFKFVNLNSML